MANLNLSVAVTDRFMAAVLADERYDLIHPRHGRPVGRLGARAVFDAIVEAAWETGDPGLLYLDAIARANNHAVPRPDRDDEPVRRGSAPAGVRTSVRFLDDVIETNRDPLPQIAAATRATRKLGPGRDGLRGVPPPPPRRPLRERRRRRVGGSAHRVHRRRGARGVAGPRGERGVLPAWPDSLHAARDDRRRNATLLSIAPTGTLGILAGTGAGIEPLYALAYRRAHPLGGEPLVEINPIFERWARANHVAPSRLARSVAAAGTLAAAADVPDRVRRLFVTATELDVDQHLAVQHAFQRHVDNAVSKTINLPESAPVETVAHAYREAWRLGLKGVTVYRSGSRDTQVLTLGTGEDPLTREHFARCDAAACRL